MKKNALALIGTAALCASSAASAYGACSTHALAGSWVFATGIGRQSLGPPFPSDKDITAIGTMIINKDGSLAGRFDVTVEDTFFFPGNAYFGTVMVNPDCTGTLSFETSQGTLRTDSIVITGRHEFLGMSQDPANLWTYEAHRLSGQRAGDDDD